MSLKNPSFPIDNKTECLKIDKTDGAKSVAMFTEIEGVSCIWEDGALYRQW